MESVKVASAFVTCKIINPIVECDATKSVSYAADVDRNITDEQLEYFKETLEAGLTDEIEEFGSVELKTEYHPIGLLFNALSVTDIPLNVCPLNMNVRVTKNSVDVKLGMNRPYFRIYEKEIEKKKIIIRTKNIDF